MEVIEGLQNMPILQSVYLFGNDLEMIDCPSRLQLLWVLVLGFNYLMKFVLSANMRNLEELDISHNHISEFYMIEQVRMAS